ncbi:MAG: UDP-N-acetylmuramoyl-L-alanyl-D-glutamate--2,6-diaminopimelate ligase [Pseudomonadales bacterium]|nr:UDP-N-acetylmuramoyl-L-alanyl-D-glutamate--2,6-diaminopimelate ligase [Pseudomonadales bacterium]
MNTAEKIHNDANLFDLIDGLVRCSEQEKDSLQTVVHGIQIDSRQLQKGDLFIACFGRNHDARDYIDDALKAGVSAVLAESGSGWHGIQARNGVPIVAVDNLAAKTSEIAARFYGRPTNALSVIGITGTNGKTSCSQFIAQLFNSFGFRCGVMGTLGYGIFGEIKETQLTTPDAVFTQMALAEMHHEQIEPVAMEVSSVGLHQKRVAAVRFDTAIFTNLTRDHLDYHESMEAYAANKRKLFTMPDLKCAVVNLDDQYALSMINAISSDVEVLTYSTKNKIATVHAESFALTRRGFEARINTPIGTGTISGQLLGYFNFSNVLAVVAGALTYLPRHCELSIETLCEKISELNPVTGRMEIVGEDNDITAVVDYAHTPDGLRSALVALRDHFDGQIWCVFGCGGNRDKGKRPLMGEIAEKFADRLILTDDNPRNEQGDLIIEHILSGMADKTAAMIERDRATAINLAIAQAKHGDVVLIAGKGHETYQEVNGVRQIFSDANQVRLAMKARQA